MVLFQNTDFNVFLLLGIIFYVFLLGIGLAVQHPGSMTEITNEELNPPG